MAMDSAVITATFLVYLAVMLAVGIVAYLRTKNLSDYVLAGRRLNPWVAALSACASDMSGWLLLGLPGFAYVAGVEAIWLAGGLLLGTTLNWLLVARRLRLASEKAGDALTIPAYFAQRFADGSGVIRLLSAAFILLFFMFYTSSGLVAGGKLFETVFGLPYQTAVLLGMAAIVSYTLIGGFLAVSWTDVIQGSLMLVALLLVPVIALQEIGSIAEIEARLLQHNPHLLHLFSDAKGLPLSWIAIVSSMAWGLGYFGQPHILARFKALESPALARKAALIAVSWTTLSLVAACCVGIIGLAYLPQPLADSETVFMVLVNALFHPLIAGVLLAAILSAVMSTADSQLLVSSSVLAEDFYKCYLHRNATDRQLLWVGRGAVLLIAIIATAIALDNDSTVLGLVGYAWAGFGAAFGPAILLSLYWPRMNRFGAMAGIALGGVTVIVWKQLSGGLFELYEIVPGIVVASIAIVVVSLLTPEPADEVRSMISPEHER